MMMMMSNDTLFVFEINVKHLYECKFLTCHLCFYNTVANVSSWRCYPPFFFIKAGRLPSLSHSLIFGTTDMESHKDFTTDVEVMVNYSEPPTFHTMCVKRRSDFEPMDETDESTASSTLCCIPFKSLKKTDRFDGIEYFNERMRRSTFNGYEDRFAVSCDRLARNGFIYKGVRDMTLCVFCRKKIHEWTQTDVVAEEHARLSPSCPFLKGECNDINIIANNPLIAIVE